MTEPLLQMRPMTHNDAAAFDIIQHVAYEVRFQETLPIFARRVEIFPEGNFLVEYSGRPVAYLVCLPWKLHEVVLQDDLLLTVPDDPDCFYIHSATVIPEYHRRGLGTMLFQQARQLAEQRGFEKMTLVSVQGSHPFWSKFGFCTVTPPHQHLASKLATYGPDARYMMRG